MGKFSSPKAPPESADVRLMRQRQMNEADKLEEEENRRKKAIARNRLGQRQLLSGSPTGVLEMGGTTGSGTSSDGARTRGGRGIAGSGGGSRTGPVPGGGGGGTMIP